MQETVNIGQNGLFTKAGNLYIKELGENCLISHNKNGNYAILFLIIIASLIQYAENTILLYSSPGKEVRFMIISTGDIRANYSIIDTIFAEGNRKDDVRGICGSAEGDQGRPSRMTAGSDRTGRF